LKWVVPCRGGVAASGYENNSKKHLKAELVKVLANLGFPWISKLSQNYYDVFQIGGAPGVGFLTIEYLEHDGFTVCCYLTKQAVFPTESLAIMDPFEDEPEDGVLAFNIGSLTGDHAGAFWNLESSNMRSYEPAIFKKSQDAAIDQLPKVLDDLEHVLKNALLPFLAGKDINPGN
jgi:hypothetical protein